MTPWFLAKDEVGFSSLAEALEAHVPRIAAETLSQLGEHPIFGRLLRESSLDGGRVADGTGR